MSGQAIVNISDKQWNVAMATTYSELVAGLGGYSSIPAGTGMLFDMGSDQYIDVTTVPMLFSLDIAFISGSLTVVGLAQDAPPGQLLVSTQPARYFLEVNAGETDGIELGDPVNVAVTQEASPAQFFVTQLQALLPWILTGLVVVPQALKQLIKPNSSGKS